MPPPDDAPARGRRCHRASPLRQAPRGPARHSLLARRSERILAVTSGRATSIPCCRSIFGLSVLQRSYAEPLAHAFLTYPTESIVTRVASVSKRHGGVFRLPQVCGAARVQVVHQLDSKNPPPHIGHSGCHASHRRAPITSHPPLTFAGSDYSRRLDEGFDPPWRLLVWMFCTTCSTVRLAASAACSRSAIVRCRGSP
jgi:hypothetical protein